MSAIPKTSAPTRAAAKPAKAAKTMSIGVVLEQLRGEFPDVTVSKIRFLESEGLITPQRTASGYRRFTDEDVERLRYILVTQRDNYLPLKVIREQLEAMDAGKLTAVTPAEAEPVVSPESFRPAAPVRLTDVELAEQADVDADFVDQLIQSTLIAPDAAGLFTADDVRVVTTAAALRGYGIDARHLKALRTAASRQADLIFQVTEPVAKSGKHSAQQEAEEIGRQMSALVVSLNAALVKSELRRSTSR
ncbi:transcriptional regulator FtsR [Corynebacterium sp. Marseille-Q4381]|uniref:transcriptional regulator FtsR n=1 Tax=Corynebacterium sp. Marseille-Q4381 TaxID=3121597 RepID=UPI003FA559FD